MTDKKDEKIDIANSQVIRKILRDISKDGIVIRVWQKFDETDFFSEGTIFRYSGTGDKMEIRATEGQFFKFDYKKEIFFHSGYKGMIFKTTLISFDKSELWVARPHLVKIDYTRESERRNFGLKSYQTAVLVFEGGEKMKVNILDISEGGMAILVNKNQSRSFHIDFPVLIRESTLDHCVGRRCMVRNKGPMDNVLTNEASFRVGFEFI